MRWNVDERCVELGRYILDHRATVRSAAKRYGISKSTVHKDVTVRLMEFDRMLCMQVREILEENKNQRHIRGGQATKEKYAELSKKKI